MPYVKTRSRVWLKWWLDSLKWNEAIYRGGCGGWVDVQWAWHYDQGLLRFFIPWANWCLFLISGHFFFLLIFPTFTSIQSDSPFFITPTSVFMNVWIFHSESVFFVLNFDLNSVFFLFCLSLQLFLYWCLFRKRTYLRRSSSKFILSQHFFILLESG